MRVSFMGTPDFAIPILDAIIEAGHEISFAATQPDRPSGRGHKLTPSPVKSWAAEHDIRVITPVRISEELDFLKANPVDVCVVAAFGQLLPASVLKLPRYGCINVHASLLPKYRGAAPIQWSILNGDKETGVTIMQMDEGLDSGDILLQKSIPISDDDTAGTLFDKLAQLGAQALTEALELLEDGQITPVPQDDSKASAVKKIDKKLGELDFTRPAAELANYVRGLDPWPVASMEFSGKRLKIYKAAALGAEAYTAKAEAACGDTVLAQGADWLIKCGEGYLRLLEVQLPGKRRMSAEEFLRGHRIDI